MKTINAEGYEQKFKLDKKGYFLIRINKKTKNIEVGYCKKNSVPELMITGKRPEEILYKIIEEKLVTELDHAGYLGKELQKAYCAIKNKKEYVQDKEI